MYIKLSSRHPNLICQNLTSAASLQTSLSSVPLGSGVSTATFKPATWGCPLNLWLPVIPASYWSGALSIIPPRSLSSQTFQPSPGSYGLVKALTFHLGSHNDPSPLPFPLLSKWWIIFIMCTSYNVIYSLTTPWHTGFSCFGFLPWASSVVGVLLCLIP